MTAELQDFGHHEEVVPTLAGIDVHKLGGLWIPFVLLNAGCALRVTTQVLTDFTPSAFPISGISGLLELTALVLWGVHLWRLMSARVEAQACSVAPTLIQITPGAAVSPITADQLVADVLARHPRSLETFLAFGFTPLKNPFLRATVARVTTVRRACATLSVDLDRFLGELNDLAGRSRQAPVHGDSPRAN